MPKDKTVQPSDAEWNELAAGMQDGKREERLQTGLDKKIKKLQHAHNQNPVSKPVPAPASASTSKPSSMGNNIGSLGFGYLGAAALAAGIATLYPNLHNSKPVTYTNANPSKPVTYINLNPDNQAENIILPSATPTPTNTEGIESYLYSPIRNNTGKLSSRIRNLFVGASTAAALYWMSSQYETPQNKLRTPDFKELSNGIKIPLEDERRREDKALMRYYSKMAKASGSTG